MDPKKEKAFDEKVKRFDRNVIGVLLNMLVSMVTAIFVHIMLMH